VEFLAPCTATAVLLLLLAQQRQRRRHYCSIRHTSYLIVVERCKIKMPCQVKYGEVIPLEDLKEFKLPIDLPEGYKYRMERFTSIDSALIKFIAEFSINVTCEVQAIQWMEAFKQISGLSLKLPQGSESKPESSKSYQYKQKLLRHHAGSYSLRQGTLNKHGQRKRVKCWDFQMHIIIGV
jgi:hypothetical protein